MLITCPACEFSREVDDSQIPERSKVATCPECGHRFQFRQLPGEDESPEQPATPDPAMPAPAVPEPDDLPEREKAGPDEPEPGPTPEPDPDTGKPGAPPQIEVPFEDLENYGFFSGMAQTLRRACFAPRLFFEVMPLKGLGRPLAFGLLVMELVVVMGALWQLTGTPNMTSMFMESQGMAPPTVEQTLNPLHLFVLVPLFFVFNLFVSAALVHGVLSVVRGGARGFEGTFRVLAYSYAPVILGVVPFGLLPGGLWSLVVTIIGLRHMHSTSYAKAILAYVVQLMVFAMIYFVPAGMVPAP